MLDPFDKGLTQDAVPLFTQLYLQRLRSQSEHALY